jgi:hypothetical protein
LGGIFPCLGDTAGSFFAFDEFGFNEATCAPPATGPDVDDTGALLSAFMSDE